MDNLIKFNPNNANSIRNIKIQLAILKQYLNNFERIIDNIKQFSYTVVETLPEASEDTMYRIYLIPTSSPDLANVKDEYITIIKEVNGNIVYSWEKIGSTKINLENYYTKQEVDDLEQSLDTDIRRDIATVVNDIANDISRTATDATFVHKVGNAITNLFYLRQATTSLAGLLSAADKTKLDGLPNGSNIYTKAEIDNMIGNIETQLSNI